MSTVKNSARLGAAVFALGLSLGVPHTTAIAAADEGDTATAPASDRAQPGAGSRVRSTPSCGRTARPATPDRPVPAAATEATANTTADAAAPTAPGIRRSAARTASDAGDSPRSARRHSAPAAASPETPAPRRTAARVGGNPAVTTFANAPLPQADTTVIVTPVTPTTPVAPVSVAVTAAAVPGTATPPIALRVVAPSSMATAGLPVGNSTAPASATDGGPFGAIQSFIEGVGLLIRRTFFNKAPTVAPVQTTGQIAGTITGAINAVDPEGDTIVYSVTTNPQNGSVSVDSAGNYTYTPGGGFTGLDGFTVTATDQGFHINLLDLFRPAGTAAFTQVAQNASGSTLTFSFIYGSGSQFWSPTAKAALESSAYAVASYVVAARPVTITYDVTATSAPNSGTLASAGSDLTSDRPGFFATVVQQKIQTGVDANGAASDGQIDWNFGPSWGYGTVTGNQYDFNSTAMHELMHTLGFLSYIYPSGQYSVATNRNWTTFDYYVVASNGNPVVNRDTFSWDTGVMSVATLGAGGDLFFSGPNAVAAYGGPVPLYTPNPFSDGSSASHLDDSTFGRNTQLMTAALNRGPSVRTLSTIDLAILKDLGYTTTDTPIYAFVVIGFGLLRRRRNPDRDN